MLQYEVTSDRDRVVDGLGAFKANETQVFDEAQADRYKQLRGVSLSEGSVPEGVTVVIALSKEG